MITTPQTKTKLANWYQASLANKQGDVLYDASQEPEGMLGPSAPAADAGMLGDTPAQSTSPTTPAQPETKSTTTPAVISQNLPQPTSDPFGGKANLNASGKPMSYAESMAFEGAQQAYDDSQSPMWNQMNGRWRRSTEPLTGALKPQGQDGSAFQQQLVSSGKIPASTPAATPAATQTTTPATTTTTTPASTTTNSTTSTASSQPGNGALLDAIRGFQQRTGLLTDSTPEQVAAALGGVTVDEFNQLSPDQKIQARELFRLAGIPVPGESGTAATGTQTAPSGTGVTVASPATLDRSQLTRRTLNDATETAQGRMAGMLDSPLAEAARQKARMAMNERGLLNSSLAVQAGEQAAMDAVSRIAESDAAAVRGAGDYNTALDNQAQMYNTDQQNAYLLKLMGIQADAKSQDKSILAQLEIAKLQDATARYNAERNDANSRYNTDTQYRSDMERTRMQMANNIAMSQDMPPARRAEMLRALGFPDLANAIYVVTDATDELGGGSGGASSAGPRRINVNDQGA